MLNIKLGLELITSKSNQTIVKISKLNEKKYRSNEKLFLCDGIKLFKEAIIYSAPIKYIVVKNNANFNDFFITTP